MQHKKPDTTEKQIAYSPRVNSSSPGSHVHVRLEPRLENIMQNLQDNPRCLVKKGLKPSKALLLRRALEAYAERVHSLRPEMLEYETARLNALA